MRIVRKIIKDNDIILTFKKGIFIGLENCPKILDFSLVDEIKLCFDVSNDKMYQFYRKESAFDMHNAHAESMLVLTHGSRFIEIEEEDFNELIMFMDVVYLRSREEIKDPLTQSPVNPLLSEFIKKQVRNVKLKLLIG